MAWKHEPCGTVWFGKNPPMDCAICIGQKEPGRWRYVGLVGTNQPPSGKKRSKRSPQAQAKRKTKKLRRKPVSAKRRQRIYDRDGWRCVECGEDDPHKLTIDHHIPISKGGTNEDSNLRTMCRPCNNRKGDSMPT